MGWKLALIFLKLVLPRPAIALRCQAVGARDISETRPVHHFECRWAGEAAQSIELVNNSSFGTIILCFLRERCRSDTIRATERATIR